MDEIADWLPFYSYFRRHASLGYGSPMNFDRGLAWQTNAWQSGSATGTIVGYDQ
jgi:hypothetical protein